MPSGNFGQTVTGRRFRRAKIGEIGETVRLHPWGITDAIVKASYNSYFTYVHYRHFVELLVQYFCRCNAGFITSKVLTYRSAIEMRFLITLAVLIISCLLPFNLRAWHIIGGELYYTCQGNNNYEITLKIYRDCNSTTPFDDPAIVSIYNANGQIVQTLQLHFPGATHIDPDLTDPCLQLPPGICVEQAIYKTVLYLPPIAGGYNLAYQRCCRNNTIVNIYDPQNTGATFTAHIPDAAIASCNSSPHFNNYPPIVICVDKPLIFDHSASDPDGDSLAYSLCTPYQGADALAPQPNPPPPPPYDPIVWIPPYNVNNQIGGSPVMNIDAHTGLLTAYPTALGQFVVGVCVKEYRNGTLLGQDVRDFQFNITTCNPLILANFTAVNAISVNDTLLICGSNTVDFDNESFGTSNYQWDFGVPGITTDISNIQNPTYTYPDTGVYKVMLCAAPGLYCGDTTYNYIEIRKGVESNFSLQNECVNVPVPFIDQSIALDGNLTGWQWSFGDGASSTQSNPAHAYTTAGTFNVTMTIHNTYGCIATVVKPVEIYPLPIVDAGPDTFVCDIDSVTLYAAGGTSYLWSPDYNISDPTIPNPLVKPEVTTMYTVMVTNNNGCVNTDSVLIQITDTVIATTQHDVSICEGDSVQLFSNNAVFYSWTPPDDLSDPGISNPMASPEVTTTYYVVSHIGSCFDEDTVTVTVLPVPEVDAGGDVTINQGESVQLNTTGEGTYLWTPPDNLNNATISNPVASPINTITYAVVVTNSNGCKSTDSVTVNVTHNHLIMVPTAFTPNGDGLNDYFQFYTKGIQKILSVKIFNRWGQQLYESAGNDEGWDGTFKGKPSELGVYVYAISGLTFDGDMLNEKGSVTLLR